MYQPAKKLRLFHVLPDAYPVLMEMRLPRNSPRDLGAKRAKNFAQTPCLSELLTRRPVSQPSLSSARFCTHESTCDTLPPQKVAQFRRWSSQTLWGQASFCVGTMNDSRLALLRVATQRCMLSSFAVIAPEFAAG